VCPVEPLPRRWNARFCLLLSLFSPADVACAGNDHCVILDEKRTTYLRDFAPPPINTIMTFTVYAIKCARPALLG
jgi:hypothetical protein